MSAKAHRTWLDYGLMLLLTLIWGSSFIIYKEALNSLHWVQVGQLRILFGAIFLLPLALHWWKKMPADKRKAVAKVGLFGSGIPPFLFALAQTELDSGLTGVLNTLTPLFTLLIGFLFFRLSVGPWRIAGLIVGLAGAVLIITNGGQSGFGGKGVYGLFAVLATLCYGTATNIIKSQLQTVHPVAIGTFAMLAIAIPTALSLPFTGILQTWSEVPGAWTATAYVALLAVLGTAIANMLYFVLVQRTDVIFASVITYLIPAVALGWGFLDGERMLISHWAGLTLIMAGVWMAGRSYRRRSAQLSHEA